MKQACEVTRWQAILQRRRQTYDSTRFGYYSKPTLSLVYSVPGNARFRASISNGMTLLVKMASHIFPYHFIFSPPSLLDISPRYNVLPCQKKKKWKEKERKDRVKTSSKGAGAFYQQSIFSLSNRSFCYRSDSNIKNFSSVSDSAIDYSSTRGFFFFLFFTKHVIFSIQSYTGTFFSPRRHS